jgi:kinesin family protein 2/24
MALKECIRARTAASSARAGCETHVPFRRSKLTLLMKDVFDPRAARVCSTVVIACLSPLARDADHSASTAKCSNPKHTLTRTHTLFLLFKKNVCALFLCVCDS